MTLERARKNLSKFHDVVWAASCLTAMVMVVIDVITYIRNP